MSEYLEDIPGSEIDISQLEVASSTVDTLLTHLGFAALDVYEEVLSDLSSMGQHLFGRTAVGVKAEIGVGCSADGDSGEDLLVGSYGVPFIGYFEAATIVLAPDFISLLRDGVKADKRPCAALVFSPIETDDFPWCLKNEYDGIGAGVFSQLALPLNSQPITMRRLTLV